MENSGNHTENSGGSQPTFFILPDFYSSICPVITSIIPSPLQVNNCHCIDCWASLMAQRSRPAMQETWETGFNPLEGEMATHSSVVS